MDPLSLELNAPDGWFSQYDIAVLYPRVAAIPENGLYLEVGVYKGRSLWIARQAAKEPVEIWGIDELDNPNVTGTHYIKGDSHEVPWDKSIDLLFIDANHSYEGCKGDIDKYAPHVKAGGSILFHDYDETSPGVVEAVNEYAHDNDKKVIVFKTPRNNTSIAEIKL